MNTRLIALASGALLTAAALAGCTTGSAGEGSGMGDMPGMDHSSSTDTAASDHNQADVGFAKDMMAHHQQAIEMSDAILAKQGVDARVTDLAQKIKAAQQPEIDTMKRWLSAWGQKSDIDGMDMGGMDMGGDVMMSQQDMDALQKASGADASKLFLTQMVQHHHGAITMATTETEKGKATDAVALAKKISSAQTAEIATMRQLLGGL